MARLVKHTATGPQELKPNQQSYWICRCGLSKNQPLCDGSHKITPDEDPAKVYKYNDDGTRTEIKKY